MMVDYRLDDFCCPKQFSGFYNLYEPQRLNENNLFKAQNLEY